MTFQEFNVRYILLQDSYSYYISVAQWLAQPNSTKRVRVCFPRGQNIHKLGNSDVVNFFGKANDGRDKRLNFAIFVVQSVGYVLAESLEREGNISLSSIYGQLADNYSHVFSLMHPVDEFSFKEMRMWGQPMISSCCLCVTCESRELRRGAQDS